MSASGRGVLYRKTRVDEAKSIDMSDLQRKKIFSKGLAWTLTSSWSRNGKVIASISFQVESDKNAPIGLRFMYTVTNNHINEKKDYSYIIPVVSTSCNYGGKRWWFICPLSINGRVCQRRCRIIYMPPGAEYFGCRECHQLTYESRQRHREKFYEGFEKPYKTAEAARKELETIRSWEKREKIWRKLSHASAAIEKYNNDFFARTPKIIYKEK